MPETIETVAGTLKNADHSSYVESNGELQSAMFNTIDQTLTEVVRDG